MFIHCCVECVFNLFFVSSLMVYSLTSLSDADRQIRGPIWHMAIMPRIWFANFKYHIQVLSMLYYWLHFSCFSVLDRNYLAFSLFATMWFFSASKSNCQLKEWGGIFGRLQKSQIICNTINTNLKKCFEVLVNIVEGWELLVCVARFLFFSNLVMRNGIAEVSETSFVCEEPNAVSWEWSHHKIVPNVWFSFRLGYFKLYNRKQQS